MSLEKFISETYYIFDINRLAQNEFIEIRGIERILSHL